MAQIAYDKPLSTLTSSVSRHRFPTVLGGSTTEPVDCRGASKVYFLVSAVNTDIGPPVFGAPTAQRTITAAAADIETGNANPLKQSTGVTYFPMIIEATGSISQVGMILDPPAFVGLVVPADAELDVDIVIEVHR